MQVDASAVSFGARYGRWMCVAVCWSLLSTALTGRRTARSGRARCARDERRIGAVLGVSQAAVLVLETYGVAHTSAAHAGLIISLTIVLTPLMDVSARGHRLPARFFTAAAVCVLGIALLVTATGLHAASGGDLLMLGAALVRAAHVALVGRLTASRAVRPLHVTTVQTAVGTVLFGVAAARQLPTIAHLDARTWGVLIYLALFCSVFAFLAQTWAVQHTSASRVSLLLGTEPIWALAAGIILGREHLTVVATIGAVLVIAGTYWGQSVERTHRATTRDNTGCPITTPTTV